jgi:peptidoglycan/xylan/chitin deacetylase (PgdA/CDA1 family)
LPVATPRYWAARSALGPAGRRRARGIADAVLAPLVGSIAGGDAGQIAITFDDGPDPDVTPRLLQALHDLGVTCTFFLLTGQARQHPELVRAMDAAGHEVALHGDDHRRVTDLGYCAALRYLRVSREELEQILGRPVRWFRPPYGAQSLATYLAARRAGLQVVVWTGDADDWTDRPVADVVRTAVDALTDGGVLLLHERVEPGPRGEPVTTTFDRVVMARSVVEAALSRGLRPATVGDLVASGARRTAWFRP